MKETFKTYKENVYSVVLVVNIFIALFFTKLIPFFLGLIILLWIFKYRDFSRFSLKMKWIWPFIFYALMFLCSFIFAEDYKEALKILERHISFIMLPFLIFCKKWTNKELNFFGEFYVKAVLFIVLFSLIQLFYFYITNLSFIDKMDSTYLQWKLPHLIGFHPTYFGLNIVVASILLTSSLIPKQELLKEKNFYIFCFLSIYLLYISPRTALFCQLLLWCWFIFKYFINSRVFKINNTLLIITLFSLIITILFTSEYFLDKMSKVLSDQRFLLWSPSFEIIKENYFLFGEGLGNGKIRMSHYILENNLTQFKGSDLHNQYLMNFLDQGIAGVIAMILLIFRPLFLLKNNYNRLFFIIFAISMLTESFLYVIKGIIMFIILSSYFILNSLKQIDQKQK